ncbi:hypothetical protein [Mycobacteroides chelonae]|uniref:hypothetical protein n=1 Tax=Mycobacteroides chelonae TaxID=1774 RepID=UPI000992E182|nr:hypothetical protein [Mycobacteroides chelonae]
MAKMPRVQKVVLPLLRAALVPDKAAKVGSWGEDIDFRVFPFINVRRVGGFRHETRPEQLALPVIEMTAYGTDGLVETEELYEDALEALYRAVRHQTQTPNGYLHSIRETMGATQFDSPFQDSWRIQGLIRLGVRPPHSS